MAEEHLVRAQRNPDGTYVQILPDSSTRPMESKTDWPRLEAMTEEGIEANALSDPDTPPPTDEELAGSVRVPDVAGIRTGLNLTQEQFAEHFGIPLEPVQDWETRARFPDAAARALLSVITHNPDAVVAALDAARQPAGAGRKRAGSP